jgi:hypothetical protein
LIIAILLFRQNTTFSPDCRSSDRFYRFGYFYRH